MRLYRKFEALLRREIKDHGAYLRPLRLYFRYQDQQGFDFRSFSRAALDAYLKPMKPNPRHIFLCGLARWVRFLDSQGIPLDPPKPDLPGSPAHCLHRRATRLHLKLPSGWPPEAQALHAQYSLHLQTRIAKPRAFLRPLHHFFAYQAEQGLTFRDFPFSLLEGYWAAKSPHWKLLLVDALCSWLRFLYARKALLLPLHEEIAQYRPRVRSRRRLLSVEQVLQVLALPPLHKPAGIRDRAMLEMAYACGIRRGELVALDLADVDLGTGLVNILKAKNSYQRNVPLTRWALFYLKLYLEVARPQLASPLSSNALWLNPFGQRLSRDGLGQRLVAAYQSRQKLGFNFSVHQLRHACATHLLNAGACLRTVQELLGHRCVASTQIYTHITPIRLRQVHQSSHPRNRGDVPDFQNL